MPGDSPPSIGRLYDLEVELLRREDDRTPFVIGCHVEDGFKKEILFLLAVGWTRLMSGPATGLDIVVTKPATNTPRWRSSFLGLDLWHGAGLLRGFEMLPTSNVRVPRASDKVFVTRCAENVDTRAFEVCGVSVPPEMGCVGMDIVAD